MYTDKKMTDLDIQVDSKRVSTFCTDLETVLEPLLGGSSEQNRISRILGSFRQLKLPGEV